MKLTTKALYFCAQIVDCPSFQVVDLPLQCVVLILTLQATEAHSQRSNARGFEHTSLMRLVVVADGVDIAIQQRHKLGADPASPVQGPSADLAALS